MDAGQRIKNNVKIKAGQLRRNLGAITHRREAQRERDRERSSGHITVEGKAAFKLERKFPKGWDSLYHNFILLLQSLAWCLAQSRS